MTPREAILQAVRSWLKLAAGLSDEQVIPAHDEGPRPALPYLTVHVTSHDIPVGQDQDLHLVAIPVTITETDPGTEYAITVDDTIVTYTRTADDTDATVVAALAAAVVANTDAYAFVNTDADGILISATQSGDPPPVVEDAAGLEIGDGVPLDAVTGDRQAVVSINSYGDGETWLTTAVRALRTRAVIEQNDDDGVAISVLSGPASAPAVVSTAFEQRHLLEVTVSYAFVTDGVAEVELGTVTIHYRSEQPDGSGSYSRTITIDMDAEA